jgi:hypothetical protein
MAIASFVLVALGVLLIAVGAFMSLEDWKAKRKGEIGTTQDSLKDALEGLAKLADAVKNYPPGQQLIVWGIVVLIIAGLFGGIAQL